jgi:hypothetical protein
MQSRARFSGRLQPTQLRRLCHGKFGLVFALAFPALAFLALAFLPLFGWETPAQGKRPPFADGVPSSAAEAGQKTPPAIVIGFLGGFIKHDDPVHSEVQLAARLRKAYPSGVDVETFESYRGEDARKKILTLLDANHDGHPTPTEKQEARIILYGHSWGASQAIAVARELEKDGIPVLLTVQVDSVSKIYQNDGVIPANVAQAANFYQPDGLVHGRAEIRAADPARTKIVGNFRFEYKAKRYGCNDYPWYDRFLTKTHTQIECDPDVWKQAEALIRAALPVAASGAEQ